MSVSVCTVVISLNMHIIPNVIAELFALHVFAFIYNNSLCDSNKWCISLVDVHNGEIHGEPQQSDRLWRNVDSHKDECIKMYKKYN